MYDYYVGRNGSVTRVNGGAGKNNKKKKKTATYSVSMDGTVTKNEDIAPTVTTSTPKKDEEKWYDGYFKKSEGNILQTILGSGTDLAKNVGTGIIGMGEKAVDALAYMSAGAYASQKMQNGGMLTLEDHDLMQEMNKQSEEFIKKDLYDEEEVAKKILSSVTSGAYLSNIAQNGGMVTQEDWDRSKELEKVSRDYIDNVETTSIFDEKSDSLAQSAGQLVATAGLQMVGLPWWATTGSTSFGAEAENALKQGATYAEAGGSALISAGAEILTEKLSGGISFGGKTFDSGLTKLLSEKIASKTIRTLTKVGVDTVGEGAEEVISQIFSNLGTSLYKEESIGELLWSEEALDGYIESFVGGAVLGGGSSTIGAVNSAKSGEDYVTGLKENETKVVEKEVENRVAEREADGKKLDRKEKAQIREEVMNDLEKGRINLDTIESVLGGETFNNYKSITDKENSLKTEIERLQKDARPAMQNRLAEAQKELEELNKNSNKTQIKEQLSLEVQELTKDSKLGESYNEKARRSQKFEADLTQYDAKYHDTIKKATESGILNNTNRTHEFVDMIAKLSADKGVSFDFTNNKALKKSGFAIEGKTINGLVQNNNVLLNVDSSKALNTIVGHEITHVLEGTELYTELQNAVKAYATTKGEYQTRYEAVQALYKDVEGANIDNELTADLVGDYLFTDSDFINNLSATKPNIFKKIYDEIKYLYKVATAGSKEARELEKVKRAFDKAYKEATSKTVNSDINLSLVGNENGIEVYETSEATKELSYKERKQKLLDTMKNEFAGRTAKFTKNGEVYYAFYDKDGLNKGVYGDKKSDKKGYKAKVNIGADGNYIELAENALYVDSSKESGKDNRFHKNAKEWDYYVKTVKSDGNYYNVLINVKDTGDNQFVYDITLKETGPLPEQLSSYDGSSPVSFSRETALNEGVQFPNISDSSTDNVAEKSDNVNERLLTAEQEEYFKDSVVRDENGNLKVMYHGTSSGGHTVFDPYGKAKYGLFGVGSYFTDDASVAQSYTEKGKGNNKQIYEVYLNIKNPIDMDAQGNYEAWKKAFPEADFPKEGTNEDFYRAMEEYFNDAEYAKWEASETALEVLESMGYDGITHVGGGRFNKADETRHRVYIAFQSEQIKNVDNTKPTTDADINLSLSDGKQNIAPIGNYNVYGKDIKLETAQEVAPIKETAQKVTENAKNSEKITNVAPKTSEMDGFAPIRDASEIDAQQSERLATIDESQMPDEIDAPFYREDVKVESPFDERDIQDVGNRKVNAYMYENPEVKPYFQEEAQNMLYELQNSIKGEKTFNDQLYYDTNGEQGWYGTKRETSEEIAYLLDKFKYKYADIEKGLKAIIEDHGAENNAISKRIEFLLDERLREGYTDFMYGEKIPANQDYINLLADKQIADYSDEAFEMWARTLDGLEPTYSLDSDIAPTKEYEAIEPRPENLDTLEAQWAKNKMSRVDSKVKENAEEEHIAEILTEEPKTENQRNKRKWAIFRANVFDKGTPFEDLSIKTKNRELMGKWNYTLYSEARAQDLMINGDGNVKSLSAIREEVESTGLTKQFYEYMYHKHNVDRMKLAERYSTPEKPMENKPVFGNRITAEVSQDIVDQYEFAQPKFMDYAQDVYNYQNYLRQQLVDNGVISQETADLWADMYPHYVPIRRVDSKGLSINVPLDTGRTGVNAPIKKAVGGSSDILPLFDTMGIRTLQTYRATAKNSFGVELKNSLGTTIEKGETNIDEVIDSVDAQENLLQEGKNGRHPTFTVFENGEKVTFEITEDMYDALKPLSDSSMLSKTHRLPNAVSNFHRGVLTQYNPVFIITNGIKDIQDVLINSQHPARTYLKIAEAHKQMITKGYWYNEYMKNGGRHNDYFDSDTNTVKAENKGIAKLLDTFPLKTISQANDYIEVIPRLAEYIASREMGRSIEVSMLDSARVTTNFRAGGDLTKYLNRNGFTFLNASVQGAMQQVRNVREANMNGAKGWANLATRFLVAGAPVYLLNALLWDDDEEYEELSDYVKQNYYIVGKYDDGKFIRIPKGRTVAVIQDAFKQMENLVTGNDEVDLKSFLTLVATNIAPSNPIENNILAPIMQVANNKTWYGDDLVPTRLQDLPEAEQYDESTDMFSRFLGEKLNISPVKINYLLDQYTGGVGDVVLPMLTPEAESGDNSVLGNFTAPLKSKFTADSVMNNQNVSDFYETSEELTTNAKKRNATDEEVLMNKYVNSVKAEMSELYAQKREIQNSDLPDAEKYAQVREIQSQIVKLSKTGLENFESVKVDEHYGTVGDRHYRKNDEGEWVKVNDKQLEKQEAVTSTLSISPSDYWGNKEEYDYAYEYPEKYAIAKSVGGYETYKTYTSALYDIKADKDENGKTISGSRKEKVIDYIDSLNADYGTKILLFKSEYNADDTYNEDIIEYLNNRDDISYDEMVSILKELGFTVEADGTVRW